MKKTSRLPALVLLVVFLSTGCLFRAFTHRLPSLSEDELKAMGRVCLSTERGEGEQTVVITSPEKGTVFPPEIAAPIFRWTDPSPGIRCWLVVVETEHSEPVCRLTAHPFWEPGQRTWDGIKTRSVNFKATVTVFGLETPDSLFVRSRGSLAFSTSQDPVDALVMYRQVPLPFMAGEENFRKIVWRLGDVADYGKPRIVMQDIPVCAGCHQVSSDGKTLSMEMNYKNDSGAQLVTPISEEIVLKESDFMTWSDVPRSAILPPTRGLFGRMSPSGKYLVSTVNEISFAALTGDPAFCQLFFPTYGILVSYSMSEKTFTPLKGADNRHYVQTNPEWSPDEKTLVFARTETLNEYHTSVRNPKTRIETGGIEELNQKFPIRFDLWKIPFNGGGGGEPERLKGACENGMSNYFPRYSPDGKWIVFTRSASGIMLQPGSELCIIPAQGGDARRLACNRGRMNSWHSWSPNGKWLVFSSKGESAYTEIFLTHMDDTGDASPPIRLSRFSSDSMAANLPEFVSLNAGKIKSICLETE